MSKGIWEGEKQPQHRDKRQQDRSATIWRQSGGKNHSNQDTSVILPLSLAYFSVLYLVILLKSELAPSCISNGSYFKISYKTHKRRTLLQVADFSTMGSETQALDLKRLLTSSFLPLKRALGKQPGCPGTCHIGSRATC